MYEERYDESQVIRNQMANGWPRRGTVRVFGLIVGSLCELVEEYPTALVPDGIVFGVLLEKFRGEGEHFVGELFLLDLRDLY